MAFRSLVLVQSKGVEVRVDLLRQAEHQYTAKELAFQHQVSHDGVDGYV